MPRKLTNGNYVFENGAVAKKSQSGEYTLIASKAKLKRTKKTSKQNKQNEQNEQNEQNIKTIKNRRSHKKIFSQTGGNNELNNNILSKLTDESSNDLNITVHILRDFYLKYVK